MEEGRFLNNIEKDQFEFHFPEGFAFGKYKTRDDNILILQHVEVPSALRGQGVGGKLMEEIMDFIRSRNKSEGLKIQPFCGYARAWLQKHPEYHDITEF